MNQTSQKKKEEAKNLILGTILACLAQIWAPEIYSKGFTSTKLDILPSYHLRNFQEIQIIENDGFVYFTPASI